MHRPMIRLLALLAAATLVVGACGDDDATSAEDEAEDAAGGAIDEQAGGECSFLGEFASTGFEEALDSNEAFGGGGEGFKALAEEFDEVADAAPDEIQEAFATLAEGMSSLADAFEDVDLSDPESFDPAVFEEIDDEKYEQASQEVEAWLAEHCPDITG